MARNRDTAHESAEEILQAALIEFETHGYRGTSVAAIASRAGVAVGTVYLAFESKYELFRSVYARLQEERFTAMAKDLDWTNPKSALRDMIRSNLAEAKNSRILAEWTSANPGARLRADLGKISFLPLETMFAEWKAQGLVSAEVDQAMFMELLEIARVADSELLASRSTLQFLIDAALETLFPASDSS